MHRATYFVKSRCAQGSKWIRQWPIFFIYIHNDDIQKNHFCKPTEQNLIEIPKVVKTTIMRMLS